MIEVNEDRPAREIIRDSGLDLANPEFKAATMERITRYNRKRKIVDSIAVSLLTFLAIDTLIWLGLRLTGMSIFDLANLSAGLISRFALFTGKANVTLWHESTFPYSFIAAFGVAAILALIELSLISCRVGGRRTG